MAPVHHPVRTALLAIALTWPAAAAAQSPAPGHLDRVEGEVLVERSGVADAASPGMLFIEGDRLTTGDGRVAVAWDVGGAIHVDRHSTIDLLSADLLRLMQGRVVVELTAGAQGPPWRVDTPAASVELEAAGHYMISLFQAPGAAEVDVSVIAGRAALVTDFGVSAVDAGRRASVVEGRAPSAPVWFNAAAPDPLLAWIDQGRAPTTAYASRRYLPDPLVGYAAVFDRYGSWRAHATYGHVWYPKVHVGWRPYHHGRWRHAGRFGWVWIGHDSWAWPTHHYGRWGFTLDVGWYWIPAAHWGPAWVHWAVAPGFVGWSPLGWNGRPVVAFFSRHDRFASRRWRAGRFGSRHDRFLARGIDPWDAWTLVPRDRFDGHDIPSAALDRARAVRVVSDRAFATQPAAPIAVPRGSVTERRGEVVGRAIPSPSPVTAASSPARALRRSAGGTARALEQRRQLGDAIRTRDALGRASATTRSPDVVNGARDAFRSPRAISRTPRAAPRVPETSRSRTEAPEAVTSRETLERAREVTPAFSRAPSRRSGSISGFRDQQGVPRRGLEAVQVIRGGQRAVERPATGIPTPRLGRAPDRSGPVGDVRTSSPSPRAPQARGLAPRPGRGSSPSAVDRAPSRVSRPATRPGGRPTGIAVPRAGSASSSRSESGGRSGAVRRHP